MNYILRNRWWVLLEIILINVIIFGCASSWYGEEVDYNAQVKPILNKRCIACHGGVKKNGGFSLMTREEALGATDSGSPAIIPGDPENSEFIRRLHTDDPRERMPFEADPLPEEERQILETWIRQGVVWDKHWAYQEVKAPEIPQVDEFDHETINYIDEFIAEKWVEKELTPSSSADNSTLLRRVSMDVIGIPADSQLAFTYLNDLSEEGYLKLVDSLLASPHFGERWASMWLDLARYADTKGYERDVHRTMYRYRDYVIKSFNNDKPYDQFLIENIAGDLLEHPTEEQYIATGFHRNTPTNDEGGTDNEEFRVAAVIDRVNTTWEAVLGTSFACTQCHGHPYDPFTHQSYYEFLSFFNNSRDEDTFEDYPWYRHFDSLDQQKLSQLKNWLEQVTAKEEVVRLTDFVATLQPALYSIETDHFINSALYDTKHLGLRKGGSCRMPYVSLTNAEKLMVKFRSTAAGGRWKVHLDSLNGPVLIELKVPHTKGKWEISELSLNQKVEGRHDLWFQYENANVMNPDKPLMFFDWFSYQAQFPGKEHPEYVHQKAVFKKLLKKNVPYSLIMKENPGGMERTTQVFDRGNWLVLADTVFPKVPDILPPLGDSVPRNRLGLALWIASEQNPLTARNFVNHVWEQIFGVGLVETLEDFGTQGSEPTHPALLDALAWKFMHEHHWSMKKLIRDIVLSATYRQSSSVTEDLLEKDPYNQWYARGARFRWSAEQVRDQTLFVSGLLSDKMYGPSVMPYQPEGIWDSPYNSNTWEQSEGEDQYRRSVYTYWKRGAPYPAMITFDAPSREVCESRRIRTNTPLQALNTLNDEGLMDAAAYFAIQLDSVLSGAEIEEQIEKGYSIALGKVPTADKLQPLVQLYQDVYPSFQQENIQMASVMDNFPASRSAHTAALTVVANAIFNLDEFLSRN